MFYYNPAGMVFAFLFALIGFIFVVIGVVTFNIVGLVVGPVWCYAAYCLLRDSLK